MAIIPVAKTMYLCDKYERTNNEKVDLLGVFNAIRVPEVYPYHHGRFCIFIQLCNGLGDVPFYLEVRNAASDEVIRTTSVRTLNFPDRVTILQVALGINGCEFPQRGVYLIDLFCNNTWVCDTRLELL